MAELTNEQRAILKILHSMRHAYHYLAAQFNLNMSMIAANSNFEARRTIIVMHNRIINENAAQIPETILSDNLAEMESTILSVI